MLALPPPLPLFLDSSLLRFPLLVEDGVVLPLLRFGDVFFGSSSSISSSSSLFDLGDDDDSGVTLFSGLSFLFPLFCRARLLALALSWTRFCLDSFLFGAALPWVSVCFRAWFVLDPRLPGLGLYWTLFFRAVLV